MIRQLLEHTVRKDLRRSNKIHSHRQYLRALAPIPRVAYWAGYHKKKLILLAVVGAIGWTYEWYRSIYRYMLTIHSPHHFIHQLLTSEEKVPKTILEQSPHWPFAHEGVQLLQKLYFQADRHLIFGVSRNYLFQVYKQLGLLQKPEEQRMFWINGGFYRKRNQLLSGVGLSEFLSLYEEAFNHLRKTRSDLQEEDFRREFAQIFVGKANEIEQWEKQFNKKRHNEFLKSLLTDNDAKQEEICRMMREQLDITEQQVEQELVQSGMKGMSIRDRWLYWRNREVLLSLREETLQRRLSFGISESAQVRDMRRKLQGLQRDLQQIQRKKEELKQLHLDLYDEEILV